MKTDLGDDVGEELVLDAGDLVLEKELFLLEPLELKRVGAARFLERVDRAVEIPVLLLKPKQGPPELANLLALHRLSPAPCCLFGTRKVSRRTGKGARPRGKPREASSGVAGARVRASTTDRMTTRDVHL